MKVAIVGSRDFENLKAVRSFVRTLKAGTVVLSGGADGVDRAAVEEAKFLGLSYEEILPDYKKHHPKLAPKIRNREIAHKCDAMVAFWDGTSGGTANAVTWAVFYGKVVAVLTAATPGKPMDVLFGEDPSGVCLPSERDAAIDVEDTARLDREHEAFEKGGEG